VIYFIHNEQAESIKIGFSRGVKGRLRQLSTASPQPLVLLGMILGGRVRERQLHRQFQPYRLHGEWFEDVPIVFNSVLALIEYRRNVWEECESRGRRLTGLVGVLMQHLPSGAVFACRGHSWGPGETFLVHASKGYWEPDSEPGVDELVAIRISGLRPKGYHPPERFLASDCVLLSPWPVVVPEPA
jgi:hypothetical protein